MISGTVCVNSDSTAVCLELCIMFETRRLCQEKAHSWLGSSAMSVRPQGRLRPFFEIAERGNRSKYKILMVNWGESTCHKCSMCLPFGTQFSIINTIHPQASLNIWAMR